MAAGESERGPEIIIVRRGGDDEDEGHHGGVWKIAFADFMTAMMCFFLVMWLINAASEETRTALASYFNPVKLIDRNTNKRGLEDLGYGPQSAAEPEEAEQTTHTQSGASYRLGGPASLRDSEDINEDPVYSDDNFFSDPYAVLAEIAAETDVRQNISSKGEGGEQTAGPSSGASGGEAYRDPFAPDFWSQQVAEPQIGVQGDPDDARGEPASAADTRLPDSSGPEEPSANTDATAEEQASLSTSQEQVPDPPAESETARPEHAREADQIRAALSEALQGDNLAAAVSVTSSQDGVLISITDDLQEGMFAVGSAVPQRTLVLAMEKIGEALADRPGALRIHGHTDGRPFASGDYDNWRLSTARAHAAYYMLARGGLDEERIIEVAGFADRKLRIPDNPLDDANRRIEILLELPQ
ncbi:MotB family protein [Chelativorans sp. YIM 93263]|uniref:MotB family protein n=1 Tax=Chelativorans sp. YIM 93263 TaxID=2906648 RepID=UPI0023798D90|nr:MotB family protein [Chelativorans sp. YIM 93263]